jgi:hypothetical protein
MFELMGYCCRLVLPPPDSIRDRILHLLFEGEADDSRTNNVYVTDFLTIIHDSLVVVVRSPIVVVGYPRIHCICSV